MWLLSEVNPAHEVRHDFAVAIRALSKKSDWLQKVLSGAQQVLVDELALGVAGGAGPNFSWLEDLRRDVRWLQRQAQNNMNETKALLTALGAETEEATVQETEVLQTYLVGNKQVLAEKELWMQPIGAEIIPGKLLCSRKAPCGRRKAHIVGCGNFGN